MKTYTIKELGEMFQIPASTIRYYEESGILTHIDRTPTGQRIFTESHINRLKTITCFKNTGMTIAQLNTFFTYEADESNHFSDIVSLLSDIETTIQFRMQELQDSHKHVQKKLAYFTACKRSEQEGLELPTWETYR